MPAAFPRPPGNNKVGILEDQENLPYNLYPFVHLLPSGNLFVFAGQLSIVLDYNGNKVMIRLGGEVKRGDDAASEDGCSLQFVIHSFGSHENGIQD